MNFEEVGKYLQEKVEHVYFNCVFTCTYGNSWIDSLAGTSKKFIMWKGITIWEHGILEVNPGSKGIEKEATLEILNLLDVEFVHALGTNNFDEIKDYYKILGVKFQENETKNMNVEDLNELEEVSEIEPLEPLEDEDDLEYVIKNDIYIKNVNIYNQDKYPESETENYWMIGIDINNVSEQELQEMSIFDRDFW